MLFISNVPIDRRGNYASDQQFGEIRSPRWSAACRPRPIIRRVNETAHVSPARVRRNFDLVRRALATALACGLVAVSLLTFPAAIAWMIAAWLLGHSIAVGTRQRGWMPLVVCVVVLTVKRLDASLALYVLVAGMFAVAAVRCFVTWKQTRPAVTRSTWIIVGVLWILWAVMAYDRAAAARCNRAVVLHDERPVVCLGDSLTSNPPDPAYPDFLAERITLPVVNLGHPGISTAQALSRLPALVAANPQVVVIELGGHDFLQSKSRAETKANLETIIVAARGAGAEVVLFEIPRGFITDGYGGVERELARQYDLELISDGAIRQLVLWSPFAPPGIWMRGESRLSDDGLHPNERGARHLANTVARSLERLYGPKIARGK